ncbi:MAG: hypothetical protein RMJ15_06480 [Nitrososphaerota archaeon]|nr:hypothetical protein [Candidatus Bathyarchaeota archaeon]MDW8023365.1 hypothetical protein [Nitrososphaerota archaeon]
MIAFSKQAVSKIIIALVVVVAVAAVAGAAYYLTLQQPSPVPSPTPSPVSTPTPKPTPVTTPTPIATPTPTPTPTQTPTPTASPPSPTPTATPSPTPTATPSPTLSPIINLRVGAYAEYRMVEYTEGVEAKMKYSVDSEETYKGVNCWILSQTVITEQEGMTIKSVVTWWMAKSDLHMVHGRIRSYVNDNLVFEQEFDPGQASGDTEPPEPVDVNYFAGYETITVPAGTFTNCMKMEVTEEGRIARTWVHPNVPVWGIVKMESYEGNQPLMTMELIAYGG